MASGVAEAWRSYQHQQTAPRSGAAANISANKHGALALLRLTRLPRRIISAHAFARQRIMAKSGAGGGAENIKRGDAKSAA